MANSVVVVGSCMMDFVCYSSRLPKEGETLHGHKFVTNFGGKGANQCVAAHNFGANTRMIARVGDDIWGAKFIQNFTELGIDTKYVKKTPNYSNGIAQICVADSGANQIVIVAGANSKLSVEDVHDAKDAIENATVVVCQLETDPAVAIETIKLCDNITILNGAPAIDAYDIELITTPSIFCVNESEASVFSGLPVNSIDDAKQAAKLFLSKGCKRIIITMGSQGAVFATQLEPTPVHVKSPTIDCVDSTGAGDAFIGCLAYLLANYQAFPLKCAVEIACCMGAESCKKAGTQCSFPRAGILNELLLEKYSLYL